MVTISIMSLLTVIMIPALRSFDRRNKVEAAAEQFKSALTEARNYSMAPRFGDSDIDRYSVKITNATSDPVTYEIGYFCKINADVPPACITSGKTLWTTITQKRMPSGVGIGNKTLTGVANLANNFEIGFMVPDSRVIYDGVLGTGEGSVELKATNNPDTRTVKVDVNTGLMKILTSPASP